MGVGIAVSGQKTGLRMPRSGHSEHPSGVRHRLEMLSTCRLELCPQSCWNTDRHSRGIVSSTAWNSHITAIDYHKPGLSQSREDVKEL